MICYGGHEGYLMCCGGFIKVYVAINLFTAAVFIVNAIG